MTDLLESLEALPSFAFREMAERAIGRVHQDLGTGLAAPGSGNLALACSAEAIGTFLLVLVGTAVATAAVLGKSTAGPAYDSLAVALAFGLVLVAVVGSLGQVSGAHVNPAVTLGLAVAGKFPWRCVPGNVLAQLAGSIAAAAVVWAAYGHPAHAVAHLGAPAPVNGASGLQVLLVEVAITFLLMLVIISVATDDRVAPASRNPPASVVLRLLRTA